MQATETRPSPTETELTPELTVREARARFWARYGLPPSGGYDDPWAVIHVAGLSIPAFPNSEPRKKALQAHDLHHLGNGYDAYLSSGEIDVSAWELGSGGCADFWQGWFLLTSAHFMGLVIRPRKVFRAFMRGRRSRNLFAEAMGPGIDGRYDDWTLGELRARFAPSEDRWGWRDLLAFAGWSALSSLHALPPLVGLGLVVALAQHLL